MGVYWLADSAHHYKSRLKSLQLGYKAVTLNSSFSSRGRDKSNLSLSGLANRLLAIPQIMKLDL